MPSASSWHPEEYRTWLALKVRELRLDPRFLRRRDESDLLQEALLRAHQHQATCTAATAAQRMRWLHEILLNVVRDEHDRDHAQKRDVALERALEDSRARLDLTLACPDPSPSERAAQHELEMRLAQAIEQLPADQGDAIVLHYRLNLKLAEIAERLGKTEKAVANLLYRAKRKLRELLEPE